MIELGRFIVAILDCVGAILRSQGTCDVELFKRLRGLKRGIEKQRVGEITLFKRRYLYQVMITGCLYLYLSMKPIGNHALIASATVWPLKSGWG